MRSLFLVILWLVPLFGFANQNTVVVIDAGSTGSRLHVYAYSLDSKHNPANIHEVWSKRVSPGFATLELDQNKINNYLETLFAGIPTQQDLPVFFYATAGMRLLSESKQQKYYQALQQWFDKKSNLRLQASETITGQTEGIFGWLALNYQLGTLATSQQSVGFMDMGGASVQIVLPIQNTSQINPDDLINLKFNGQTITLFSHSFIGLGQTALSYQFLDSPNCFASGYPLPNGTKATGDAFACESAISKLITLVRGVDKIIPPVIASNQVNAWYTFGGLGSLAASQPFHFEHDTFTSEAMLAQADAAVCHNNWDEQRTKFPDDEYAYLYCFASAYYYALTVEGYGLPPNEPIHFLPNAKNNDWTLGVVLHQNMTEV